MTTRTMMLGLAATLAFVASALAEEPSERAAPADDAPTYVGTETCIGCHD